MTADEQYLLALLRAELRGEAAPDPPEGCMPGGVFAAAERHSVAGMAFYPLERAGRLTACKAWRAERDKAIARDVIQHEEFGRLTQALESAGVRFLPLKGCIIKRLYPQSDMRTMSDTDLLIDEKNAQTARGIMEELGYTCEHFGYDVHDIYYKPPVMNVELHRALFGEEGREFAEIFSDPWSMCECSGARCDFTPDAFFAYVLAHALKHLEEGGTGVRTVMDAWVCVHADLGINAENALALLAPSGRSEEARALLSLAEVWFADCPHTPQTKALEDYVLGSGTYGTVANAAEKKIEKRGRAAYLWGLLFPPFAHMRQHYPVLKKAPVLLPCCWVARLVTKPFVNRAQNAEKLRTALKK